MVILDRKKFLQAVAAAGYTKKDLAAATCLSEDTVCKAGVRLPIKDRDAKEIAAALNVELDSLIQRRLL